MTSTPCRLEGAKVHAQAVFDQVVDVDDFLDAGHFGVILLHGHDLVDVLDVPAERIQLLDRRRLVGQEMFGELGQIRQAPACPWGRW